MLSAIDSHGKKICLINYSYSEISAFKNLEWFCPACHASLTLKNGLIKQSHFAHISLKNCEAYSENESELHLSLKYQLAKWFQQAEQDCQIEYYVKELKQIPDLLINQYLAIEIQCSPLSIQRFNARTKNYLDHGYQVIWLLGEKLQIKSKLTDLQLAMCHFSVNSGVFLWQISPKKIELIEMLHVKLDQSISYRMQVFDFFQGNIMNHLRLPYRVHENDLSATIDRSRNKLIVDRGLYYGNRQWLSLQLLCYQKGLVLQNLPDYFYFPGIFPLFYQPIAFRIELVDFLKHSRTFSELIEKFTGEIQQPILINGQFLIKSILAFELQCLAAQRLLMLTRHNKLKMIDKKIVLTSIFKIQSPLQINQWLSRQLREGKKNEKREIIDS